MTTTPTPSVSPDVDYPTSDGKPMAETAIHRKNMVNAIFALEHRYANDPRVDVGGNLLMYYVRGDRRRHVSPDVYVSRDIVKDPVRDYYLVWDEGKGPDLVIEFTSASTRDEDLETKFLLYRNVLRVREYFLFDPMGDYLEPPLQGYRLVEGQYVPIEPLAGRLPSEVVGLHLERVGEYLRLYEPSTGQWLPTPDEEKLGRQQAESEVERLRAELDALRAARPSPE